jgi:cytoskeletal protein RodZ
MPNEDRRRLAQLRLRARRVRDGELRRRAVFLSLSLFALLWVAVFAQMVSGHDPVLTSGNRVAAKTNQSAPQPTVAANAQDNTNQSDELSGTSSTATQPAPVTPAPVVTSQS